MSLSLLNLEEEVLAHQKEESVQHATEEQTLVVYLEEVAKAWGKGSWEDLLSSRGQVGKEAELRKKEKEDYKWRE